VGCAVASCTKGCNGQEQENYGFGGLLKVYEQQRHNKAEHGEGGEQHGVYELGHCGSVYFPDTYQVFVGGLGRPSGFSHYVKYIRVGVKSQ